jgi:hypothetical protein
MYKIKIIKVSWILNIYNYFLNYFYKNHFLPYKVNIYDLLFFFNFNAKQQKLKIT